MIEALTEADLDAALNVTCAAIRATQKLTPDEWAELADHIAHNFTLGLAAAEDHLLLKAVREGKLAGVIPVKQFWNLAELYVDPQWQGRGMGRELLQQAWAVCAIKSPRKHLRVNSARNAVGFFIRHGFTHFAIDSDPP